MAVITGDVLKVISILIFLFSANALAQANYSGSNFSSVWQQVSSDVYTELPENKVKLSNFFNSDTDLLASSAKRTIVNKNDILPKFKKLLHPNGICLKGIWKIEKQNKYSGYFKKNSQGLIISRISVALSETKKGSYRGFGITGKIFPTTDEKDKQKYLTANFFTIDDLSGTLAESILDTQLTNRPKVSVRLGSIFEADIASAAAIALSRADQNPLVRQMYEVATLGKSNQAAQPIVVPALFKLSGTNGQARNGSDDFREEILLQITNEGYIEFDISVADKHKPYTKIGTIKYIEAVASDSCDHRLHFAHPKFLKELE